MGIAATALLHALFPAILWGEGAAGIARLPDAVGSGANSGNADGSTRERMIIM